MPALNVTVKISGLDEAQTKMARLSGLFEDFSEAMELMGKLLISFYGDTVFVSEGEALNGKPWTPLASSTKATKDSKWPGRGILQESGYLQDSFVATPSPLDLFITNIARTPNGEYSLFEIHQKGTDRAGRGNHTKIPARPMLGINTAVEDIVRSTVNDSVNEKIATALNG